jgi:hypothetical protein
MPQRQQNHEPMQAMTRHVCVCSPEQMTLKTHYNPKEKKRIRDVYDANII